MINLELSFIGLRSLLGNPLVNFCVVAAYLYILERFFSSIGLISLKLAIQPDRRIHAMYRRIKPRRRDHSLGGRITRALTGVYRLFQGDPFTAIIADLTGFAEQFARGFDAKGIPRDVVGPMLAASLPLVTFDEVREDMFFRMYVPDCDQESLHYCKERKNKPYVKRTCMVETYRRLRAFDAGRPRQLEMVEEKFGDQTFRVLRETKILICRVCRTFFGCHS